MQEWGGKNAIKSNLIPFYFSAHTPVKMKMGWYCLWLIHWHVTETRAKWHVTFSCFQVGWILAHLRQASTNARLYTFESQSGVISCTLQNSWPWHVKFLWDLCMHAACRFRHKKIQQIFKSQFLCNLSKLHAMWTKVDEGLPDPYPVPLFLWKGGRTWPKRRVKKVF